MKFDAYQMVTDRIVDLLEPGHQAVGETLVIGNGVCVERK